MAGCYLTTAVTKIDTDEGKGPRFMYAVANCQGWRNTQEDAHIALPNFQPNTSLFGIFDGHNGPEVAKFVSKYLPSYLMRNANYNSGNIERGLQEVFLILDEALGTKEVNDVLYSFRDKSTSSKSNSSKSVAGSSSGKPPLAYLTGTTAVVLLIKNDIYYCVNVGDSRCIISRDFRAHALSRDHKPDHPDEKARIEKAGGTVNYGRINMGLDVSRTLGDLYYKNNSKIPTKEQLVIACPHSAVEHIQSKHDQFIVMMCDGIWNAMPNQELVDFIQKRIHDNKMITVCEDVIRQILPQVMPKTGIVGKDNMTVMIIKEMLTSIQHSPGSSPPRSHRSHISSPSNAQASRKQQVPAQQLSSIKSRASQIVPETSSQAIRKRSSDAAQQTMVMSTSVTNAPSPNQAEKSNKNHTSVSGKASREHCPPTQDRSSSRRVRSSVSASVVPQPSEHHNTSSHKTSDSHTHHNNNNKQ